MRDLLRFEFRKLRTQKSFYICLAIMIAMILITGITYKVVLDYMPETAEAVETEGGETLPKTFSGFLLGFLSASNFSLIAAVFVSIVVCTDYEGQIIKNIYARGYSRENYYLSKLIYVFTVTTVMFLAAFTVSALFGAVFFGTSGIDGKCFLLIAIQYLASMAEVALYFAISSMIKKLGGAIAICIFAPMLVSLLLGLGDTALKLEDFKITNAWLSSFTSDLANSTVGTGRIVACAVLSVVYAVLFIAAGFAFNRKTEV